MFDLIKNLKPNLSPTAIHCDFEQAAFAAIEDCFPGVNINGCFFHLAQNMKKHVAELGHLTEYNNDAQFALNCNMVTSLAFVLVRHLDQVIDVLGNALPVALQPLLDWFKDNYVGRRNRRGDGRRPPLFPQELWNLYQRTMNREDRTNNYAEPAHRRLQTELGVDHPTIWKFIDSLRKVHKGRDVHYKQLVAGNLPPLKKKKKYRDADGRILRLVRNFNADGDILQYLRGLAHNYKINQKEQNISQNIKQLMQERREMRSETETKADELQKLNKEISKAVRQDTRKYNQDQIEHTIENNRSMKVLRKRPRTG
ncbi:uncharacterized protein LOC126888581 [Diabrotica virgifera virgifera]|uniref:MULE transposase domain-containing protein n=1 Tax=Diabrotica virgifera virgifera TaxID=50390 RepID=A0ABM5KRS6_DIAVI|nr:uncharacterized protein LOC126888581 [Diabrotica virgifera virgifera]